MQSFFIGRKSLVAPLFVLLLISEKLRSLSVKPIPAFCSVVVAANTCGFGVLNKTIHLAFHQGF